MKKWLILIVCILTLAAAGTAFAASSGTWGTNGISWTLSDAGALSITSTKTTAMPFGDASEVPWNSMRSQIKSVSIGNNITSVGAYAFRNCVNLKEIKIPSGVKTISVSAFSGCTYLEKVSLPNTLTTISLSAFSSCSRLRNICIPNGTTTISQMAFNASGLRTIVLPATLTKLDPEAFTSCSLSRVYYNGTQAQWDALRVTESSGNTYTLDIGSATVCLNDSFCGAGIIWDLDSYGHLSIQGTGAMYNFNSGTSPWYSSRAQITSVDISAGITSIGAYAFSGCANLKDIVIPASVTSVGQYAFSQTALQNVYYYGTSSKRSSVTISATGNSQLTTSATWNYSMISHGYTTDSSYSANTAWYLSGNGVITFIGSGYMLTPAYSSDTWRNYAASIKTAVISEGITSVAYSAFGSCTNLTSVSLPSTLQLICQDAFKGCTALETIAIPSSVTDIQFCAFEGAGITSLTISNSACVIDNGAFADCASLTDIDIASAKIGDSAFMNCQSLKNVTLRNTVKTIGTAAFANCDSLESIPIPSSVTSVAAGELKYGTYYLGAFAGCSALSNVTISSTLLQSIDCVSVFRFTPWLMTNHPEAEFTIDTSTGCLTAYNGTATEIAVPSGVKSIGSSAFNGYMVYGNNRAIPMPSAITSIIIPEGVETFANYSFFGCTALKEISIPITVTSVGDYAFSYCSELADIYYAGCADSWASVTIGNGNTYLSGAEFHNASVAAGIIKDLNTSNKTYWRLDSEGTLTISGNGYMLSPDYSAGTWRNYAASIKTAVISEGITSVAYSAFGSCTNLTSVSLPSTLQLICQEAFKGCTALETIAIPNSVTDIQFCAFEGAGITSLTIGNSACVIDNGAFADCASLTDIDIASAKINDSAFMNCQSLKNVTLRNTVKTIGISAFANCVSLKSISIPSSVTSIAASSDYHVDPGAFARCTALETVSLPSTLLNTIDKAYVFNATPWLMTNYPELEFTVNAGNCLTSYNGVSSSVTIPNGVVSISDYAFCISLKYGNSRRTYQSLAITEITVPETVMDMGDSVSRYLNGIERLRFKGNPPVCDYGSLGSVTVYYPCGNTSWTPIMNQYELTGLPVHGTDEFVAGIEPSCTTDGMLASYSCPVTEKYYILTDGEFTEIAAEDLVIPAIAHMNNDKNEAVEETCTTPGSIEYYVCRDCGLYLISDGEAFTVITADDTIVPPHPHTEIIVDEGYPASCEESGVKPYSYCEECGSDLQDGSEIPATGHQLVVTRDEVVPTCSAEGATEEKTCEFCKQIIVHSVPIDKLPHTPIAVPGKPASCTDTGLTEGSVCEICSEVLLEQTTVPALGHTPVTDPAVEAGCTETGLSEGSHCDVCGETIIERESVPAKGHTPVSIPAVSPTDRECGYTEGSRCDICGETLLAPEQIPANFSYDETGTTVIAYNGDSADVTIPAGVTALSDELFRNNTAIRTVRLSDDVTTVGRYTFNGCTELTDIYFADSVSVISATSLTGVTARLHANPGSVAAIALSQKARSFTVEDGFMYRYRVSGDTVIGTYVTGYSGSDTELTIPADLSGVAVTSIYNNAFANRTDITMITIPDSVTSIVASAFTGCTETLTIRSSMTAYARTYAANNGFAWLHDVHEPVILPGSAPTCGAPGLTDGTVCAGCGEIVAEQETIPALRVHHYSGDACSDCGQSFSTDGLQTFTVPAALTALMDEAFAETSAEVIIIPDSCVSIGSRAFADCAALRYIFIPAALESTLPEDALSGCEAPIIIYR